MNSKRLLSYALVGLLLLQGLVPAPAGAGPGAGGLRADARNVELVGQFGGACAAVAVWGSYACIGIGARLAVVDIANPAHPTLVGGPPSCQGS